MSAIHRLKSRINILETNIQLGGNKSDWIEARYNFTKQMKILIDKLTTL